MKRLLPYMIGLFAWCGGALSATSQVLVRATLDKDSILIGEPLKLSIDVRAPLGQAIRWFALDTIPHFEFIEKGKVDTADGIDGKAIQQSLTITSFDSGAWVIEPMPVVIGNRTYYTDSIPIKVTWAPFSASEAYHDIKDITAVPPPAWLRYLPWIIALAVIAAAIGIYFLLGRKKVAPPVPPVLETTLTPYEEAMQALDGLRSKGWNQNGQVKIYYSRLNDILRVFVWRRLRIASLEKTNDELIMQLRQLALDKDIFYQLASTLRVADFVKFAKYQPDAEENEKNLQTMRAAITSLNQMREPAVAEKTVNQ